VAQNESFDFAGPAGRLEGLLMHSESAPLAAAVVCHAHPLQGGMMHFKVVFRAAKALQEQGLAVLRFNFRGVGRSEGTHDLGRGEQDDVVAAMDEVAHRFPGLPLALAGFSFGSAMALQVAANSPRVRAVAALGFPLRIVADTSFMAALRAPRLFVQGERDVFGDGDTIRELVARLPDPKTLVVVKDSDHFFGGHLDELHTAVGSWAAGRPWERA
jgi:uncharacterized protein